MTRWLTILGGVAAGLLLAVAAAVLWPQLFGPEGDGRQAPEVVRVGDADGIPGLGIHEAPRPVPALVYERGDGTEVGPTDWMGRVVVLNLWATWCAPCREEMPSLDRLESERGGEHLMVAPVSVGRDGAAEIRDFYEETGVTHLPVLRDPEMSSQRGLGVQGLPTTVVIDHRGREVARLTGVAEWDGEAAWRVLAPLVEAARAAN